MAIRRVKRIALSGTDLTITIGKTTIPLTKISYGDKLETGTLNHMGAQEISARTRGTYSTDEVKIGIDAVVYRAELYPLLAKDGYGNAVQPVVVTYAHPDLGSDTDLLEDMRITAPAFSPDNSNKAQEVEITGVFNQLKIGNERKTLNSLDPSQQIGNGF